MFLCLQNLHPTYRLLLPSSSVPLLTALNLCFIHTLPSHSPSPTLPSVSLPLPALSVSPPLVQPFFLLLTFSYSYKSLQISQLSSIRQLFAIKSSGYIYSLIITSFPISASSSFPLLSSATAPWSVLHQFF